MSVELTVRGFVDDEELSALHARAFGGPPGTVTTWAERLQRHSLTWVTGTDAAGKLVGFVNVIGDGGHHAVLLDTVVEPELQGHGVGRELVARAAGAARELGCEWLHVDFEADLARFYLDGCGFRTTAAGLLRLT
jgi:ribosomal protein S18 acetylase RimI-like enzyme